MKKFLKKVEGFTLVELIVVIAILGILAAVAVPAYTGYMDKAKEASDTQTVSAMNTAFAAACTEAGYATTAVTAECALASDNTVDAITVSEITGVTDNVNLTDAQKTAEYDKIEAAFGRYFVGNDTTVFKYYKSFTYAGGNFAGSPNDPAGGNG